MKGFNIYKALLKQTGTDAPIATVLTSTLAGTLVWNYIEPGIYEGVLAGAFPTGKVFVPGGLIQCISGVDHDDTWMNIDFPNEDTVSITLRHSNSDPSNDNILGSLGPQPFEIQVKL